MHFRLSKSLPQASIKSNKSLSTYIIYVLNVKRCEIHIEIENAHRAKIKIHIHIEIENAHRAKIKI